MDPKTPRANLVDALGQALAYYPSVARIVGIEASIFLMQLVYWSTDKRSKNEGWVYKDSKEWFRETGLSYKQQKAVRASLRKAVLVEEHYHRLTHRLYFRVVRANYELLLEQVQKMFESDDHEDKTGEREVEEVPNVPMVRSGKSPYSTGRKMVRRPPTKGVGPDRPKGTFDSTEITAESTTEIPTPKSSSGGRGLSSPHSFSSNEPGDAPTPQSNKPIINPGENQRVARAVADQKAWELLRTLFPKAEFPADDPRLCRKFVKAREGLLNDNVLEMLVRYYKDARSDEHPSADWKVWDYYNFLKPNKLEQCIPIVKGYLREQLQDHRFQLGQSCHYEVVRNEIALMHDRAQTAGRDGLKEFLETHDHGVAAVAAYIAAAPVPPNVTDWGCTVTTIDQDALKWDLGHNIAWILWCRKHNIPTVLAFGFTEAQILEMHAETMKPVYDESRDICRLLNQPYTPPDLLAEEAVSI